MKNNELAKVKAKAELKKIFPKHINEINIGIDTSTNFTGYAISVNGKIFDFGRVNTTPTKVYENYANRLLQGSSDKIASLTLTIFTFFKKLTEFATLAYEKEASNYIDKINIVFEATTMPNGGKKFFAITTTCKLMLYIGAIAQEIKNVINAVAWPFINKIEYKFCKATEWQNRLSIGKGSRVETKKESIRQALEHLEKSNFKVPDGKLTDDEADAINISRVASVMRDNLFTSKRNKMINKQMIQIIPREIAKAKQFMANMESKAVEKRLKMVEQILFHRSDEFKPTTAAEKAKKTRSMKHDISALKEASPLEFMTPKEKERYQKYFNKINQLHEQKQKYLDERKLKGKIK